MYTSARRVYLQTANYTPSVEELNETLVPLHIPAIVFVSVCIVIGVFGNLLVLATYKTRFRRSNHRYFILFLAAIDFVACITGMPFLVASLRLPYMMTSSVICKSLRYIHYLVNNSSGLLLLVISVERFRKICHPFKTQLSSRQTLYLCYLTVIVSALVAVPAPVFYGASKISTGIANITGYQCYADEELEEKLYFEIYQAVLMIEAVVCIVIFFILYCMIIRRLWTSDQFIEAMRSMKITTSAKAGREVSFSTDNDPDEASSHCSTSSSATPHVVGKGTPDEALLRNGSTGRLDENGSDNDNNNASSSQKSLWRMSKDLFKKKTKTTTLVRSKSDLTMNRLKGPTKTSTLTPTERLAIGHIFKHKKENDDTSKTTRSRNKHSKATARVTIMLFAVSLVFALSFIPHLALMLITSERDDFLESLSTTQIMVYQVFLRSFIINNVANPIIYLFCDTRFRKLCKELCLSMCCNSDKTRP